MEYHPKAPLLEYHQNVSDSCFFGGLTSGFIAEGEKNLKGLLKCEFRNRYIFSIMDIWIYLHFLNDIMRDQVLNPGKQRLCYNINKWIKQVSFEILHDISLTFTLVTLMYTVGNVNHAVSIFGYWIFDSN